MEAKRALPSFHRVRELAEQFGTPLYVYDAERVRENYSRVVRSFPTCEVFYSLKANPALAICSLLCSMGASVEVASGGELAIARRAGFSTEAIVYAGPAKRSTELRAAIAQRVASINIESEEELARIQGVAAEIRVTPRVSLRINPLVAEGEAVERMGGGPSQFGIDEETIPSIAAAHDLGSLHLMGFHSYVGSQMLDAAAIRGNLTHTLESARRLADRMGFTPTYVGLGGGFGVPYSHTEDVLELEHLGATFEADLRSHKHDWARSGVRLGLELGRYLVADAGLFLTQVLDVKVSRGTTYVVVDGGMNGFLRPAFMRTKHPISLVGSSSDATTEPVSVVGPLCTPLDAFATGLELRRPAVGDLLAIHNAGAYGFSMSMLSFLSHDWPAEVITDREQIHLIRGRRASARALEEQFDVQWD